MKVHKASFRTAHTDVNDNKKDTSTWAEPLSREDSEDENYGIHLKMGQTETPTMAKCQSQVDNVASSYSKIKSVVAKQVAAQRRN